MIHLLLVHSMVQNIQNLFRLGVGILPGLGWGRIKNYHLAFRHNSSAIYIHTLANSYYFFAFAFALQLSLVSRLSLSLSCSLYKPVSSAYYRVLSAY